MYTRPSEREREREREAGRHRLRDRQKQIENWRAENNELTRVVSTIPQVLGSPLLKEKVWLYTPEFSGCSVSSQLASPRKPIGYILPLNIPCGFTVTVISIVEHCTWTARDNNTPMLKVGHSFACLLFLLFTVVWFYYVIAFVAQCACRKKLYKI